MLQQVYKQKTEVAKKEYLKALAAYRASLVSKVPFCFLFYMMSIRLNKIKIKQQNQSNFKNKIHCDILFKFHAIFNLNFNVIGSQVFLINFNLLNRRRRL